jgi:phage-related protein
VGKNQIEIIINATDKASPKLEGIAGNLQTIGKIALGAAGAVVGAAAGIGAVLVKFTAETGSAMNLLQAQTGATADEMAMFRQQAMAVYKSGFGESVSDIATAMAGVNQSLGETGDQLQLSTQRALILRDTFGIDVTEGVSMAATMVKGGLAANSEEAFDIITTGFQQGLNQAGDFGNTLREYSSDFVRLGFNADQTMGILNAGLEAGAFNTDVVADGFRELNIRLMEGGDEVAGAFSAIGMGFDDVQASIAAGDESWGDYLPNIVEGLMSIDNEIERNAAGVALFGTKWEDIGGDIFLAAGLAGEGIATIEGATDAAGAALSQRLGPMLETLKRQIIGAFVPALGELLTMALPLIQQYLPQFVAALQSVGEFALTVAQSIGEFVWMLQTGIEPLDAIQYALGAAFGPEVGERVGVIIDGIREFVAGVQEVLGPVMEWLAQNVELQDVLLALGVAIATFVLPALKGIIAAAAPIIGTFLLVVAAAAALRQAWETNFLGIRDIVQSAIAAVTPLFERVVAMLQEYVPKAVAFLLGVWAQAWPIIEKVVDDVVSFVVPLVTDMIQFAIEQFEKIAGWIQENMPLIQQTITKILTAIQAVWNTVWPAIQYVIERVWGIIKVVVSTAIDAVLGIIKAVMLAINGDWEAAWEQIKTVAQGVWDGIKEAATLFIEAVLNAIGTTLEEFKATWETNWDLMLTIVSGIWERIKEAISTAIESIKGFFTDTDWGAVGLSIIQGIANGITDAAGVIADAAKGAAKAAFDAAKGFLGIDSPSKLFKAEIGHNISAGMAEGIMGGVDMPVAAARGVAQATYDQSRTVNLNMQPTQYRQVGTLDEDARWAALALGAI